VSFVAITLCVASQVFIVVRVYFVMTQSRNFWIHPDILPVVPPEFACSLLSSIILHLFSGH